ncbi:MAG: cobalt-precorrin 5A hydrolase [Halobacteriales archaeon]|jgi:cobalt-precorrin 5A hydrolase
MTVDRSDDEGDVTVGSVAVVTFERNSDVADRVREALVDGYDRVDVFEYVDEVFADHWVEYDCFVAIMASGIAVRKIAPLLSDKWADPAVVVVDEGLTWVIPLVGGHHGANALARDLAAGTDALPAVTTASEVEAKPSVEARAAAIDATVENRDSTVATNLAVLNDDLGPVERLEGPRAVLVDGDVTVLRRRSPADGHRIVLGTGCVGGADPDQILRAWERALDALDRDFDDVEFVATGTLKADEEGLHEAAARRDVGVVTFDRETLSEFEGPSSSRAADLIDWPGIAEASAIAGGREHDLLLEKRTYDDAVTVAVGR